jgi:hypothetical protein
MRNRFCISQRDLAVRAKRAHYLWLLSGLFLAGILMPLPAMGGSFVTTVQPANPTTTDAFLRQSNPGEKHGTDPELDINADLGRKNKQYNVCVNIPVGGLSGKTVLQAWLRMSQYGSNAPSAMNVRAYPLTEAWQESQVSWQNRNSATPWTSPGGTHGPTWSDEQAVSGRSCRRGRPETCPRATASCWCRIPRPPRSRLNSGPASMVPTLPSGLG